VSRRSDQRRAAAFALYQHDVTDRPLGDVLPAEASRFTRALAHAAEDYAGEADDLIGRHAKGWTVERIAPLERSIMRVALTEMLHPDVVPGETPIPAEGAISEAVETAKTFCGAEAPGFVNGVLNAALQDIRQTRAHHG
jgi:transcription antitermination protein NusB